MKKLFRISFWVTWGIPQDGKCNGLVQETFQGFNRYLLSFHPSRRGSESFSLGELIQDIVQKFQLAVEKKKIRLQTNLVQNLPFVFADIGLLKRVFENLIENAIKYTPESGSITIAVVPKEERLRVQVSDTGVGVRPEDLPHLFDRSYWLKKGRPRDTGATGLGLAITKRVLELHGSDITADSVVDAGTTFTFTLPIYRG